ncbi:MAG: flagellar assembly protein FliW [bacterium]|nr:flagellar assembly protein FliW [bacterium]
MADTFFIENNQLGKVEIDRDKVVIFPEGLIGFEDLKNFVIIDLEEYEPFQWLLCVDDPDITFPIISPIIVVDPYEPDITREMAYNLGDFKDEDLLIYTIVTIRPELNKVTANLLGPIIINQSTRLGHQVVLKDDEYSTEQEFMTLE